MKKQSEKKKEKGVSKDKNEIAADTPNPAFDMRNR